MNLNVSGQIKATLTNAKTGETKVVEQKNLLLDDFIDHWFTKNVTFLDDHTMHEVHLGDSNVPAKKTDMGLAGNLLAMSNKGSFLSSEGIGKTGPLENPTALPPDWGNGCSFSPDGSYLAVEHDSYPYLTIYKRDGEAF